MQCNAMQFNAMQCNVVVVVNHCFTPLFGTNGILSDIAMRDAASSGLKKIMI